MNPHFRSILDASRLTRAGSLEAATQAIQRALQSASTTAPAAFAHIPGRPPFFSAPAASTSAAKPSENFVTASHSAAGLQRDYKLFVPSARLEGRRQLVVMLHGCTQNPDDFAAGTAINAAAEEQGFYVLYPWQSDKANAQRCWNWFKHSHQSRGRGEPEIIADMTRAVAARHSVDLDRIYVAGLSAGGAMAAILGERYADVFAAVAVHSGLPAGVATDLPSALALMRNGPAARSAASGKAIPTIVFHGDTDAVVHPANGDAVFDRSGGSTADIQVERLNKGGRACTRRTSRSADGKIMAEHWRIHDAAHAWSGGRAEGSYTDVRGPSATDEMMRFFGTHVGCQPKHMA